MKINIKTKKEIEIMAEAGKKLAKVKRELKKAVKIDASAAEIEKLATKLIEESGAEPSFKKVKDYKWSTCINLNDGVVHGIPHKSIIFAKDDVVSVDVGLFYKGFHSDTSFSIYLGKDPKIKEFLKLGRETLDKSISKARVGNIIEDIARNTQEELKKGNASPIKALVGHGIGRELHEEPMVPCYVSGAPDEKVKIVEGMTLAIEIMYTMGKPGIKLDQDGWTLRTKDGKLTALFEETVAVTAGGPNILTRS